MISNQKKKRLIYLIISIMALAIIIIIGYSFQIGAELGSKYTPLIDACMAIKAETAKATVCLDEILFGEELAYPEELDEHLKEAEWHAQAILNGGSNWEYTYQAVITPTLIEECKKLIISIKKYRGGIELIVDAVNRGIMDSSLDFAVDSLYTQVQAQADELEESLQDSWKADQAKFKSLQIALIFSCVILGLLIIVLLVGYEKSRARALIDLQRAKSGLENELNERRKAETALRTIFDTAPNLILSLDKDGTIIDCNDRIKNLLLFDPNEIRGRSFNVIIHPQSLVQAKGDLRKTIAQGSSYGKECQLIRKDFEIVDVRVNSTCIYDDNDFPTRIICVMDDVAEVKKREKILLEQYQLLKTTIDSLSHPFYMIDANTYKIIIANHASGYNIDFGVNDAPQTCYELTHRSSIPCHLAGEACPVDIVKRTGQPVVVEHIHFDSENNRRYSEVHGYPVFDVDGRVSRIIEYCFDITEGKKSEEQQNELRERLQRAEKMEALGLLAGGIAHDLNNMLGPLVGYPELMMAKLPEDSPLRKNLRVMAKSAGDAAAVIQDLLTLARRGRCELIATNLNNVIINFLESPAYKELSGKRRDVRLQLLLNENISNILGSEPHLAKVIMNLVGNAYEAMGPGGKLKIQTTQSHATALRCGFDKINPGEYISLSISDTGAGIPPEDMKRIFEPYFSRKKMGESGSGLGLSIVYGIVKDHKGYYDVISELGKGTEFILYFPASAVPISERPAPSTNPAGHETVLIIDDSKEQCDLASEMLRIMGYTAVSAGGGREAVEYLKSNRVDIVLLDMIMEEGFGGLETYQEILKINPNLKAVIISGYSETDQVQETQKLGAGQFIRKPFSCEELAGAIRAELDKNTVVAENSIRPKSVEISPTAP